MFETCIEKWLYQNMETIKSLMALEFLHFICAKQRFWTNIMQTTSAFKNLFGKYFVISKWLVI